jgi:hypothetical protein
VDARHIRGRLGRLGYDQDLGAAGPRQSAFWYRAKRGNRTFQNRSARVNCRMYRLGYAAHCRLGCSKQSLIWTLSRGNAGATSELMLCPMSSVKRQKGSFIAQPLGSSIRIARKKHAQCQGFPSKVRPHQFSLISIAVRTQIGELEKRELFGYTISTCYSPSMCLSA